MISRCQTSDQRVELIAALIFFFVPGAIASPYPVARLVGFHGPGAPFAIVALPAISG